MSKKCNTLTTQLNTAKKKIFVYILIFDYAAALVRQNTFCNFLLIIHVFEPLSMSAKWWKTDINIARKG